MKHDGKCPECGWVGEWDPVDWTCGGCRRVQYGTDVITGKTEATDYYSGGTHVFMRPTQEAYEEMLRSAMGIGQDSAGKVWRGVDEDGDALAVTRDEHSHLHIWMLNEDGAWLEFHDAEMHAHVFRVAFEAEQARAEKAEALLAPVQEAARAYRLADEASDSLAEDDDAEDAAGDEGDAAEDALNDMLDAALATIGVES